MIESALSLYGLTNKNQPQNNKPQQKTFSEKISELNHEIRLEHIKLSEQIQKSQDQNSGQKPKNPSENTPESE